MVVRACPYSEGNLSQIPLPLVRLEMEQEQLAVVAVTAGLSGCRGDKFLAADFESERDAKSQTKKARPGHTRTHGQESELKSYLKKRNFVVLSNTSSPCVMKDSRRQFLERKIMQLFQTTAVGGNRADTNTFLYCNDFLLGFRAGSLHFCGIVEWQVLESGCPAKVGSLGAGHTVGASIFEQMYAYAQNMYTCALK